MYFNVITQGPARTQTPVAATLYQLSISVDRLRAAFLSVLAEKRALENNTTAAIERAQMDDATELSNVEKGLAFQEVM